MEEKTEEHKHEHHIEHAREHHEEHKHTHAKQNKLFHIENIFIGVVILLGIVVLFNIVLTSSINKDLKKSTEAEKEKLRPASIELVTIKNSKCTECFDISAVISYVKSANANVTKERTLELNSKEGKELISKYKIEKIPALVVIGEIDKLGVQNLERQEDALLFTKTEPPYTNAITGKVEGKVAVVSLTDPECQNCNDLSPLINQLNLAGVKISEHKNISSNSEEGRDMIKKYGINFVPTLVLSQDAGAYTIIQQAWLQIGSKESDGSYVLRQVSPPFINLTTGKLQGIVDIVYLTDKSCSECYNVSLHRNIIVNPLSFAIRLDKEETFDVTESKGKELIAKYNITQVPTIIMSSEVSVYPSNLVLKQFFSVEKDGSYVFRRLSSVGAYKDLQTNQIVVAQQQAE